MEQQETEFVLTVAIPRSDFRVATTADKYTKTISFTQHGVNLFRESMDKALAEVLRKRLAQEREEEQLRFERLIEKNAN